MTDTCSQGLIEVLEIQDSLIGCMWIYSAWLMLQTCQKEHDKTDDVDFNQKQLFLDPRKAEQNEYAGLIFAKENPTTKITRY